MKARILPLSSLSIRALSLLVACSPVPSAAVAQKNNSQAHCNPLAGRAYPPNPTTLARNRAFAAAPRSAPSAHEKSEDHSQDAVPVNSDRRHRSAKTRDAALVQARNVRVAVRVADEKPAWLSLSPSPSQCELFDPRSGATYRGFRTRAGRTDYLNVRTGRWYYGMNAASKSRDLLDSRTGHWIYGFAGRDGTTDYWNPRTGQWVFGAGCSRP